MQTQVGPCTLELQIGDITEQDTDAIVNAANSRLSGGGGVDGAIHRVGGSSIMAETWKKYPQGCPSGDAVITGAGHLLCKSVIHAVGPIWNGGRQNEEATLASAYSRSLQVAIENHCLSVALPSLSTGAYLYPIQKATKTALQTVLTFLEKHQNPQLVRFVLFDAGTYQAYSQTLQELLETD
tara:strand:+ start:301 stop:846 length:546 start_codon:yes stop_codon:yes gene_type:complete